MDFWSDRGIPTVVSIGGWYKLNRRGKSTYCDQLRGPMYPWHRLPQERVLQGPKLYQWDFGVATMNIEKIKELSTLPDLLEDSSVVGFLWVEEQQMPIATMMVHQWQYHTNRDSLVSILDLIHRLESQERISKTCSPFRSPIQPVQKLMEGGG